MFGPPLTPSQEHTPFKGMDLTKVIRLEPNTLLERIMDLNSLTWLLVTCLLFQTSTDSITLQFWPCNYLHPNQVQLPIFNILRFTLNVGGEEVPCNLTQVVYDTPRGTLAFGKTITTFYEFA